MTLFEQLDKYADRYQISFQMGGKGRYTIFIDKDDIDIFTEGGHSTANEAIKSALDYLNKINKNERKPKL